jgi:hypothetical protein
MMARVACVTLEALSLAANTARIITSIHLSSINILYAIVYTAQMSTVIHLASIDIPHVTPPL